MKQIKPHQIKPGWHYDARAMQDAFDAEQDRYVRSRNRAGPVDDVPLAVAVVLLIALGLIIALGLAAMGHSCPGGCA